MKLVPEIQDVSLYMQYCIATCTHTRVRVVYTGSCGVWRLGGGGEWRMECKEVCIGLDKDEGVVAT